MAAISSYVFSAWQIYVRYMIDTSTRLTKMSWNGHWFYNDRKGYTSNEHCIHVYHILLLPNRAWINNQIIEILIFRIYKHLLPNKICYRLSVFSNHTHFFIVIASCLSYVGAKSKMAAHLSLFKQFLWFIVCLSYVITLVIITVSRKILRIKRTSYPLTYN